MDSVELYDKLLAMKLFETIPAIILSANVLIGELEKRSIVGLRKPLELSVLLKQLHFLLE